MLRLFERREQKRQKKSNHEVYLRHHDSADVFGILQAFVTAFQPDGKGRNVKILDELDEDKGRENADRQ